MQSGNPGWVYDILYITGSGARKLQEYIYIYSNCICYIYTYAIFGLASEGKYWANTKHVMSSDDSTRLGT